MTEMLLMLLIMITFAVDCQDSSTPLVLTTQAALLHSGRRVFTGMSGSVIIQKTQCGGRCLKLPSALKSAAVTMMKSIRCICKDITAYQRLGYNSRNLSSRHFSCSQSQTEGAKVLAQSWKTAKLLCHHHPSMHCIANSPNLHLQRGVFMIVYQFASYSFYSNDP